MIKIPPFVLMITVSSTLGLLASPSFADTTIKVKESGEGGGTMAITLDPSMVKAGPVVFDVRNEAVSEEHEMVVVKLKSADQQIPFSRKKDKVDERNLTRMGEVEDLKPGADGKIKVTLKPGTYLLLCNIKGHYSAGMRAKLEATP
jgi:uncharacterized cupredoxin-like copper-binding protein